MKKIVISILILFCCIAAAIILNHMSFKKPVDYESALQLAISKQDISYCNAITKVPPVTLGTVLHGGGMSREGAIGKCIQNYAIATTDPNLCMKLDEVYARPNCLRHYALEKDPTICNLIEKEDTGIVFREPKQLTKQACLWEFSEKHNDLSVLGPELKKTYLDLKRCRTEALKIYLNIKNNGDVYENVKKDFLSHGSCYQYSKNHKNRTLHEIIHYRSEFMDWSLYTAEVTAGVIDGDKIYLHEDLANSDFPSGLFLNTEQIKALIKVEAQGNYGLRINGKIIHNEKI